MAGLPPQLIWSPQPDFHDPNPPIQILDTPAAAPEQKGFQSKRAPFGPWVIAPGRTVQWSETPVEAAGTAEAHSFASGMLLDYNAGRERRIDHFNPPFPPGVPWRMRSQTWNEITLGQGDGLAQSISIASAFLLDKATGNEQPLNNFRSIFHSPGRFVPSRRPFTETPPEYGSSVGRSPRLYLPWFWPGRDRFFKETSPRVVAGIGNALGTSVATAVGTDKNAAQGWAVADADAQAVGVTIVTTTGLAESDSIAELTDANVASIEGAATSTSAATAVGACRRAAVGEDIYTYRTPDPTIIGPGGAAFRPRRNPQVVRQNQQNDAPNFFEYETDGPATPLTGQKLIAEIAGTTYFEGPVVRVGRTYEGQIQQPIFHVTSQDYTFFLNRRRPFGCYNNVSATTVVTDLFTRFTSGLTLDVEAGLPAVSIELDGTLDFSAALTNIVTLIGGHWRFEGTQLKVFVTETAPAPDPINDANVTLLREQQVQILEDLTQIRTRVFGRGAGARVLANTPPGSTSVQVEGLDLFPGTGGLAFAKCQVIRYTGKATVISEVDRGAAPDDGSGAVQARFLNDDPRNYSLITNQPPFSGGGLAYESGGILGPVKYFISFVRAGKGESDITPLGPFGGTTLSSSNHQPFVGVASSSHGFNGINKSVGAGVIEPTATGDYLFMWRVHGKSNMSDVGSNFQAVVPSWPSVGGHSVTFTNIPATGYPSDYISGIDVFRRKGMFYYHIGSISNGSSSFTDNAPEANLRIPLLHPVTGAPANLPGSEEAFFQAGIQAKLTLPLGDDDTTARRIYRQEGSRPDGGGADLTGTPKLLVTIPDNTTTIYHDSRATALASGQPVTGEDPPEDIFITRYFLTGIPTSGEGAIIEQLLAGDTIHLWVQEDDLAAQIELAAKEGGNGIHEYTIVDESLITEASLRLRCQVELQVFARPVKTVTYSTRDPKSKAGLNVTFALTHPPISGTFRITDVRVDQIHLAENPALVERYTVTASSAKFTLDDLLRKVLLR